MELPTTLASLDRGWSACGPSSNKWTAGKDRAGSASVRSGCREGAATVKRGLAKRGFCTQIVCVKTITYPLRLNKEVFQRVKREAGRRHKKVSELFRDLIDYGLPSLPPLPDEATEAIADTWAKLGPAPDVDYDKL